MKIIFLNAFHGFLGHKLTEYYTRTKDSTDIYCLQEATGRAVTGNGLEKKFCKTETMRVDNENDYYCCVTLFKKNANLIRKMNFFEHNKKMGLAVYTKIKLDQKIINIVNIHGAYEPGDKRDTKERLQQSKRIIEFLNKVEGIKIIGGDFNLLPDTESIKMFEKGGYRNLIDEFKIPTTRNEIAWKSHPIKQLYADYVFVDPNVKVRSFEVPNVLVSDHLPLVLEIEDADGTEMD